MFSSKRLVSKKGPLGAIWVAAYFFKKLKKSQISETDISSSVDSILQDQLETLAYRVLAYLLLGVVRIYSKKVEYLFDDCQEVLIKINEFVVSEKNRAKKEALRASWSSITRPVSFDLDAFDLEVLEDTSRDNVVSLEEITLKDVAWKNTAIRQYSLGRFAALDDEFLMDYTPPEHLTCHLMDLDTEAGPSDSVLNLEASMEKLQFDESFNEEVPHLKTVSGTEEEPSKIVEVSDKNDGEQTEVPDMAVSEKHLDQEASREKCNDGVMSEERGNHYSEGEEDSLVSLRPLAEDQVNRKETKHPDPSQAEDYVNIVEALAVVHRILGLENHMGCKESRENCTGRFFSEGLNHRSGADEECLSPVQPFAEEQDNSEVMKGQDLPQPENEVQLVTEEDHVSILEESVEVPDISVSEICTGTDASSLNHSAEVEKKFPGVIKPFGEEQTNADKMKGADTMLLQNEVHQVSEENLNLEARVEKLQTEGFPHTVLEKSVPPVRPLAENIQTVEEQVNLQATMTSEDGKHPLAAKDHPLSVKMDTSPQTKWRNASGATTPHFTPIKTPATKERARFSRKRKCFYDETIVFPNDIVRQWIKDASDLVSKRRKDGYTGQAASKTFRIYNFPQSFSEASVPCASELKSLYCGKRLRVLESIKITKPSENADMPEAPPLVGPSSVLAEIAPEDVEIQDPPDISNLSERRHFDRSSEQAGIAPQTPVRLSPPLPGREQTEIAPQTPRHQTEIAPQTPVLRSKLVRPFESPENLRCDLDDVGRSNTDPNESTESLSMIGNVEKEPSLGKDEDLDLNLDIHSNEDDKQGQGDDWSMRTRMVAKYFQKRFLNLKERGEEEKVKLLQLLEGKTKKASARLFYEILVLKTKGLVNVRQDTAFGDILVLKSPQWDNTYRTSRK